jgi:hypothetical protein
MRTLAEMSCGGLEWTRLSVQPQLGTVSERGHRFSCSMCVDTKSFVTWMMDLGIEVHWMVVTWVSGMLSLGGLHGSYTVGAIDT